MRLLHIGDVHLRDNEHGDDTVRCLDYLVDLVEDRGIDVVLIPGDVFDAKSTPAERRMFREWLGRLRSSFAGPVLICRGNHDAPLDLDIWNIVEGIHVYERPDIVTLGKIGNMTYTATEAEEVEARLRGEELLDIMIVPWPQKAHLAAAGYTGEAGDAAGGAALADMLRAQAALRDDPERPLVVMGHLTVTGAQTSSGQPMVGREIEIGAGTLTDLGACYCALGHIHKHQEMAPGVVYAGGLTGRDHGETEKKGVVVVEIAEGKAVWQLVPVPSRPWITIDANVDNMAPEPGCFIEERIYKDNDWTDVTDITGMDLPDANVRYRYTCAEEHTHLFDHAEIEKRFAGTHSLKIVPEIDRAERVRSAEVAAARTPREKLCAWGEATEELIPERVIEKLDELMEVQP